MLIPHYDWSVWLVSTRKFLGLRQQDVAEAVGRTRQAIAAIEAGKVRLPDDVYRFMLASLKEAHREMKQQSRGRLFYRHLKKLNDTYVYKYYFDNTGNVTIAKYLVTKDDAGRIYAQRIGTNKAGQVYRKFLLHAGFSSVFYTTERQALEAALEEATQRMENAKKQKEQAERNVQRFERAVTQISEKLQHLPS